MNKLNLISVALAASTTFSLQASELAYLYKDPRTMGMGGAGVAVGGYSSAVFSNPAGLAKLQPGELQIDLLGLHTSASSDMQEIVDDINDATKEDDATDAILRAFAKHSGTRVHGDVSNYSSLSMNHGPYAWSVGLLAVGDANIVPHANAGAQGFLETQARVYGGVTAGFAQNFNLGNHTLTVGISGKYIKQKSYEGTINANDIVNADDVEDAISDKLEKDGNGFSGDLGIIYQMSSSVPLKPAFGLSALNIGKLKFNDAYGSQPTTINLGVAIHPELGIFSQTVVALDYVDLFNANNTRYYNLDDVNGNVSYTDVKDEDVVKRIRFGAKTRFYDVGWSYLDGSVGLYQGKVTGGVDLKASIFKLGFSTYVEQLGPSAGDYDDRRYTVNLGISW